MTERISAKAKQVLLKHIAAFGNEIFSVTFRKRSTGEIRKMVCRRHVTKGVKGTSPGRWRDDWDNDCVTVFEMAGEKSGYKRIPMEGIIEISPAPMPTEGAL